MQTLFKSISKNKKKLPDPCKSKWNSSKGGSFSLQNKQAAILKSTYQNIADPTTSFLICVIILWLSNGKKRKRW